LTKDATASTSTATISSNGAPHWRHWPIVPRCLYYAGGIRRQNNDVYNGPVDDTDNDGDGQVNEDHVDGKDDDADGVTDEDWWGGNSEPETKFIQDLTEMNDDTGDGASEFKATIDPPLLLGTDPLPVGPLHKLRKPRP